ncbi:unnamed protein product [Lymnaea stagnalis]|uniref:Carboxylesterase type B domain-containing protein n=1 Tax=Lymnaea stagnalis TaxID=6523 RepID=A0AAV2IJ65_LYMST
MFAIYYLEDTIDARKQKPHCIDRLSTNETTSEDCLYLNIFLKDINQQVDSKKKVLVSLYDESEFSYDPGSLVTDHDIIVVIVQYRTGPFGYLAINNGDAIGNYGLWDQVLALKWVKNNIGAFGGDPDDVTVAWNEKAQCLALSPMSKGLFTKVFATGGMTWYPKKADEQSDKEIIKFAKSLKCWKDENATDLFLNDKLDIIQCLRSLPTLDPSKTELFHEDHVESWSNFDPVMDGDFIPKLIPSLLKDDPHLEDIGFYDRKYFITIENNIHFYWADIFLTIKQHLKNIKRLSDDLASKMLYWYQTNSHLDPILELQTDFRFTIRAYDILDTIARGRHTNVWFLHFNHYPDYLKEEFHGMIYNLDLLYLFDIDMDVLRQSYERYVTGEFEEEDYQLKKSFSSLVAAFVLNG